MSVTMVPTHFLWFFSILSFIVNSDIYSCPRIRKAWHLITDEEKQLFISGIHRINDEGKIKHFGLTHHQIVDSSQAHFTSEFFAWHRYFLWEFENQIRRLGPEYECFSLPYWDITTDSGLFENAYIFKSGLGGIGDIENNDCVDTENNGAWSRDSFPLQHICHELEDPEDNPSNGCCLKRAAAWMDLSGVSSYTQYIKYYNNFGAHDGFRWNTFARFHGEVHGFVGGVWANYTHMISRYSSEDPLFYLLHSWFDYIFVVWKQCWGYNQIDIDKLDNYPAAYYPFPKRNDIPSSELDDKLYFVPMEDLEWWEADKFNPTARTLWNEQDWNMQYERGTFIARSHLTALCTNTWDTDILLENSQETMDFIEELRGNDGESEVDRYQHLTWEYMNKLMNDDESMMDIYNEEDYLQSWEAKTCNFKRQRMGKQPCYIPQEYEKCTEYDLERQHEITIDELLKKEGVAGNDCLEEVRINTFPFAKAMGMLYQLCMGELDKYQICDVPNIDFMIDLDDDGYYNKLIDNKQRMKEEKEEKETNNNNNKQQQQLPVIGGNLISGNYPRFDVIGYLIVMFVIGGCAFIVMIRHCCKEYNSKLSHSESYQMKSGSNYGSMVEML